MVNIVDLNEEDLKTKIPRAVVFMQRYFGSAEGKFFKYESNGNEYIFNRNGDRVVVMWDEDGELVYAMFYMDKDYNVVSMELTDFMVDVTGENLVFYQEDSPIQHIMYAFSNPANQFYNSLLAYSQINKETDERLTLFYSMNINKDKINLIYPHQIETPSAIQFDKKFSKLMEKGIRPFCSEKYLLFKSFPSDIYYDRFSQDEESLNYGEMLQRYLRCYGMQPNGLTFFPYCKCWKKDELFSRFQEKGFRVNIPQDMIDSNNEGLVDLDEFMEIAECLKAIDLDSGDVERKLILRLGDYNGDN